MDTPSITKPNAWQSLSSRAPWTLSDDWEEKKDAEKRTRYAPVLDFFNSLQEREGWTMTQFNFTVGVRGSISNELSYISPRCDAQSFQRGGKGERLYRLANRTFEAHDLMLRSYYAVKFSSSSQVDFSRLVGTSFAIQHCIRLLS
jgi:hypothetical protein